MAAPSIPTTPPEYLIAGTTWQWTQKLYDQASGDEFTTADAGTVKLHLNGKTSLEFSATDNGDGTWLFSLAPTATPGTDDILVNGNYRWDIFGTLATKVYSLGFGTVEVRGYPDTANASDNRTHAEKMLALIEAELQARVPGTGAGVESFQIGTRQFAALSLETLEKMRAKYAAEVAVQRYGKLPDVEAYFVRA
jgi:hypothetical protein